MLDAMRRGAQSWVAKILFGVLVLSFAIWGVADMFRGWGQGQLAMVGPQVTLAQFQQAYQNEMNAFSNRLGKRLTPEQARQFGLDARVLARLIGASAIEAHTNALGLAMSNETLAEIVRNDPAFADDGGQFSKVAFDSLLRQAGMSEGYYLDLRRKDELREEITSALIDGLATPPAMVDLLHNHREETRVIEHADDRPRQGRDRARARRGATQGALRAEQAPVHDARVPPPSGARARPRRDQVAHGGLRGGDQGRLRGGPAKLQHAGAPARTADRLPGPGRGRGGEEGHRGRPELRGGRQGRGGEREGHRAWSAAQKRVHRPENRGGRLLVEGGRPGVGRGRRPLSTVLLRVTGIEPGFTRTLEDVRDKVRDKLAAEKAAREIQRLHDEVDDGRAAGPPLSEIAAALGRHLRGRRASTARTGHWMAEPAVALPHADKIVAAGFEAQVGIEHEVVELPGGGFAWVDALGVTPETQKPFETVQAEVRDVYFASERRRLLSELAARLAERLRNGEPMATIAAEVGGAPETTLPVTRTTIPQGLTQAAVTQAFALPKGGAGSAETADGTSRTLFRVTEITPPPPPTAEQAQKIRKELEQSLENDVLAQYVAALQDRLGVSVNEQVLRRALGSDVQQ